MGWKLLYCTVVYSTVLWLAESSSAVQTLLPIVRYKTNKLNLTVANGQKGFTAPVPANPLAAGQEAGLEIG